jgi:large subunit ribosomal protein L10
MRAEKKFISEEYVNRLNQSPFFIVTDYNGLKVGQFSELRTRLRGTNSEIHVVKNTIFRIAAQESGVKDIGELSGQIAVVTGESDISATAKVLKTFQSEFEKPEVQFGYLEDKRLNAEELKMLADLPSIEVLRSKLLGTLLAPASMLVRLLNTPATQLVQVLKAKMEKDGGN